MSAPQLGDIADINPRADALPEDTAVSFVGMAEMDAVAASARPRDERRYGEVSKGYTQFRNGDLLVAKITGCWENTKIGIAQLGHPHGAGSTEFHVIRPHSEADNRYLLHFIRRPYVVAAGTARMSGSAGQKRVPASFLAGLPVPLPSLSEQRRIAAILDHADTLRAKRRQVITKFEVLKQEIFTAMFAGLDAQVLTAAELMPTMRNGLSPATGGAHSAQVLTLSAVTQGRFDPSAAKPGLFNIAPPVDKRVTDRDFLMCRGNGNKSLVGVGTYAREPRNDLVFPTP